VLGDAGVAKLKDHELVKASIEGPPSDRDIRAALPCARSLWPPEFRNSVTACKSRRDPVRTGAPP